MLDLKKSLTIGLVIFVANLYLACVSILFQYDVLHSENGLLENVQAIFLALATLGFLCLLITETDDRVGHTAVALLCFSFLLRELELELFSIPTVIQEIGSGQGRKALLGTLWTGLALYSLRHLNHTKRLVRQLFSPPVFLLLSAVLALLMVSFVSDKEYFDIPQARLLEELAETSAYLLILLPLLSRIAAVLENAASRRTAVAAYANEKAD